MFDNLEDQMHRGEDSSQSRKVLFCQLGGVLVAFCVFLLLGWAMWTYTG